MEKIYWRCDSDNPIEGITYIQMTKLLQVNYLANKSGIIMGILRRGIIVKAHITSRVI